ncbi:MAG: serine/threonine protein kinase [Alphaproteobacteria bacterium]|nr:serine/threonine protein kinase [Alphaproteobacteria bacterium]
MTPDHHIELLEELGAGAIGRVHRARFTDEHGLIKEVAVKTLRTDLKGEDLEEMLPRLRDEARLLAMLRHPAFVRVDRLTRMQGRWAILMELVPGLDLSAVIRQGPVPEPHALGVIVAVAEALDEAWRGPGPEGRPLRLVHRDIKPGNIRLSEHGAVKLLDFGIARGDFGGREAQTHALQFGTMGYMAPECLVGQPASHRADVYALGVVLVELLAGARFSSLRDLHAREGLAPKTHEGVVLKELDALGATGRVSAPTLSLIARCLAYDLEERPDAAELARDADALACTWACEPLKRWAARRVHHGCAPLVPAMTEAWTAPTPLRHAETVSVKGDGDVALGTRARRVLTVFGFFGLGFASPLALTAAWTAQTAQIEANPPPGLLRLEALVSPPPERPMTLLIDGRDVGLDLDYGFVTTELSPGLHEAELRVGAGCAQHLKSWCGVVTERFEAALDGPTLLELEAPAPPLRPLVVHTPGLASSSGRVYLNGEHVGDTSGALTQLVELTPGVYEVVLEVGDCARRCERWTETLVVPWADVPSDVQFLQASPVEPPGPPPAVSTEAFAGWLRRNPEWTREAALERDDVGPGHLASWSGARPPDGQLGRAMTELSWEAAKAYCARRGGLASIGAAPRRWTPDAEHPREELRQDQDDPVLRLSDGTVLETNEHYSNRDAGFRCAW